MWRQVEPRVEQAEAVAVGVGVVAVARVSGHGGQVDLDGEVDAGIARQVIEIVVNRQCRLAGRELDRLLDPYLVSGRRGRAAP